MALQSIFACWHQVISTITIATKYLINEKGRWDCVTNKYIKWDFVLYYRIVELIVLPYRDSAYTERLAHSLG